MFSKIKFDYTFFSKTIVVIQIILGVLLCGILYWTSNKGLDLSDESLYLIFAKHDVSNLNSIIRYDIIFKLLHKIFGIEFGLIGLRCLRFLLTLLVLVFSWFALKKHQLSNSDKFLLFFSAFAGYSIMPQTLSYYSLTFFLVAFFGFILYKVLNNFKSLLCLVIGIIIAFEFLVKPPVALLLYFFILFVVLLFLLKSRNKEAIKLLIYTSLGFLFILSVFSAVFSDFSFLNVINDAIEFSRLSHNANYKSSFVIKTVFSSLKWSFILILSGYCYAFFKRNKQEKKVKSKLALLLFISLLSFFLIMHFGGNRFGLLEYGIMMTVSFSIGYLGYDCGFYLWDFKKQIFVVFLFVVPFLCNFGSNVYFFRIGVHYVFFWLLLIVLLENKEVSFFKLSFSLVVSILVFISVYKNLISCPFNQPPLNQEFAEYCYGNKKIYLPKKYTNYLSELRIKFKKAKNDENQGYVIGMYRMPGDIIMSDMKIFYNPLIYDEGLLNIYVTKAKYNAYYRKIKPLILSQNRDISISDNLFSKTLIDSVKHFNGSYVYIYQTN